MGKRSVKFTTYTYANASSLINRRNTLRDFKRQDLPLWSHTQLVEELQELGHDGRQVNKFEFLVMGRAFLTLDEINELIEFNITFLSWKNDVLP